MVLLEASRPSWTAPATISHTMLNGAVMDGALSFIAKPTRAARAADERAPGQRRS
jgi:hypothetical protein